MVYRHMSPREKTRISLERAREPAIACPLCETKFVPDALLGHMGACAGVAPLHFHNRWIAESEACSTARIPRPTLRTLERRGVVRSRADNKARQVLLRDVIRVAALRFAERRLRGQHGAHQ